MEQRQQVVIVGGGFAGIAAAQSLNTDKFEITLIDKQNYHLFQPLLYQVATGSLNAPDIATPLRMILSPERARVVQDEVVEINAELKQVLTSSGDHYSWDFLILAIGLGHSYFGNDQWAQYAPSLKYLEDAFEIRDRILSALEIAETCRDMNTRERELRFMVVGGGPTGVELAGALGELTGQALAREFKSYDPRSAEILLIEAGPRILPQYSPNAANDAVDYLSKLGVKVATSTKVIDIDETGILLTDETLGQYRIEAATIIWAAGASATTVGLKLCEQLNIPVERGGKIQVDAYFRAPGRDDVFIVGDLAIHSENDQVLPGLAPAAEQAGRFVGKYLSGLDRQFEYKDRGQLAVIGRNAAVGQVLNRSVTGSLAWWLWLFVHIRELIGFDVKIKVTIVWLWKFLFNKYGARIISVKRSASKRDQ